MKEIHRVGECHSSMILRDQCPSMESVIQLHFFEIMKTRLVGTRSKYSLVFLSVVFGTVAPCLPGGRSVRRNHRRPSASRPEAREPNLKPLSLAHDVFFRASARSIGPRITPISRMVLSASSRAICGSSGFFSLFAALPLCVLCYLRSI
jgi:hypothetical protein